MPRKANADVAALLDAAKHPRRLVIDDMRHIIVDDAGLLEWKGPDRASVTVRDAGHLTAVQSKFSRLVKAWAAHVA